MPNAARFARGALVVAAVAMLVDSAAAAPGPSRREARRRTRDLCAQQVNAEDPPLHSAEVGLSELAMSGMDARRGMLAVAEDRDPRIAACVAEFLMRIDEPQVRQILRRRLRTAKPSGFAALDLLADVADPAALPAALSLSSSSNATARHSAVVALGRFDEPRARARLRAMLAAETDLYAVASSPS